MEGPGLEKRNIFVLADKDMGVVIIPFDYEQLPDAQRKTNGSRLHRFRQPSWKLDRADLVRAGSGSRPGPASALPGIGSETLVRLGAGRDHKSTSCGGEAYAILTDGRE